jgi:hypothetical protein
MARDITMATREELNRLHVIKKILEGCITQTKMGGVKKKKTAAGAAEEKAARRSTILISAKPPERSKASVTNREENRNYERDKKSVAETWLFFEKRHKKHII